jgi:hypothetical protein
LSSLNVQRLAYQTFDRRVCITHFGYKTVIIRFLQTGLQSLVMFFEGGFVCKTRLEPVNKWHGHREWIIDSGLPVRIESEAVFDLLGRRV